MIPYHSVCAYQFVVCVWTFLKAIDLQVFFINKCTSLCHPSFLSYYFQCILLTLWCLWLSLQVASYVVKQKDDDVEVLKVAKKNRHLLYGLNSWLTSFAMIYIPQKNSSQLLTSSVVFSWTNPSMFPQAGPFPCYYFSFMFILIYLSVSIWIENSFVVWTC